MSFEITHGRRAAIWQHAGFDIAVRAVTALVGGYVASASLAAAAARLLPIARVEATAWAMNLSFLVYAAIALWCFAQHRLRIVVMGVWGIAAMAGGAAIALGVRP